jgi:hypothetical protein
MGSKNKSKIILQKLGCAKYAGAEITRANSVHREVDRAKDLSAPRYVLHVNLCVRPHGTPELALDGFP